VNANSERKNLKADTRGAIVLMGVFMSAFLVGGLWFVMGIGEAALYRETVQAGADSTAFTAAVYHARGMNIVAMVNIVIGAVLAITAAATMLAQMAALVLSAAETMCDMSNQDPYETADGTVMDYSYLAFACEAIDDAVQLMTTMQGVIALVNADTGNMLASLSVAQIEVGRTSPWLGSAQGAAVAGMHAPFVASGGAGSPAMVPTEDRYGLPVQNEPFDRACDRGSIIVGKLVELLVPAELDPILEYANINVMAGIPSQVCRGGNSGTYDITAMFNEDDVCENFADNGNGNGSGGGSSDDDDDGHHGNGHGNNHGNNHGNQGMDQCEDDFEDNTSSPNSIELPEGFDDSDLTTKGIYSEARNGNDWLQVYSFVRGDTPYLERSDGGVEAPTWGGATVGNVGSNHEDLAVAQAEYYYDQTPDAVTEDTCWIPCPAGLTWPSYKENALWNLRWRARLRRYRIPADIDPNVLTTAIPDLGVGYSEGVGPFNEGVGMANTLSTGQFIANETGAGSFIGSGSELIH
jgi:hypothetical protein